MPSFYTEWFGTPDRRPGQAPSPGKPTGADEIIRKIRAEAVRQGLHDPDLAVAVAMKESSLKPEAWGDRGASLGLFQLQRAAAIDARIDPDRRQDVDLNIEGGVRYLKQKLDQSGGNVEQALRRYNSGTPTFKGLGDPAYVDRTLAIRRDLENPAAFPKYGAVASSPLTSAATRAYRTVRGAVTPVSAEAAPVSPARQAAPPAARSYFHEFFGQAPGLGPAAPAPTPAPVAPAPALTTPAPTPAAPAPVPAVPSPAPAATTPPAAATAPPPAPGGLVAPYGTAPVAPPVPAFAQPGAAPLPRSPALAAEQQQEAELPWWQRGLRSAAGVGSSPEIARLQQQQMRVEQARTEMTPPEREELRRREGQSGVGADVGEMVGQAMGSAVLPGFGTAVFGTAGAVTGMTAETLAREGRLPTWKEVGKEALWSAVPEVLESSLRGIGRRIGSGTQGGRLIRLDEAVRRAREHIPEVFQAQTRQQVGAQFDAVRASGVQLDVGPLQAEIRSLSPGKYADALADVRRIDQANQTGGKYQRIVEALRNPGGGTRIAAVPVGDLQDFRSYLRQHSESLKSTEAQQLVDNLQQGVDDAIDAGLHRGRVPTGMTVDDLQEARRQWARTRADEDLRTLVERSVHSTQDLSQSTLNLRQVADALRRNENPLARRINRSLDVTPGARAEFQRQVDDMATLYRNVELPMADVFGVWRYPGFALIRQGISSVLASPRGREMFRNEIVNGRGRLSFNALTATINAVRREEGLPTLEEIMESVTKAVGGGETPGGLQPGTTIQVEPGRVSR